MVRSPAEKEHQYHSEDQPGCLGAFVPLAPLCSQRSSFPCCFLQGPNGGEIEEGDCCGWQQKPHHVEHQAFSCLPPEGGEVQSAGCNIQLGKVFHCPEHETWDAQKDAKEPDEQADPFGHSFAPYLSVIQGMDKSQVAIRADGHEQVDAGVHVQGDGGADAAAQEGAKRPVKLIIDVLCPEREAHEEDKISNSQVHKVDFSYLQGAFVQ